MTTPPAVRTALEAEPEGSTMAVDALVALERIQHGDVSHGSDDFDEVANALNQLRRWDTPSTPPTPELPLSSLMAQELAEAEQRHGRFDASETIERLGRCHSAMSARGDVQSAALCQHAATLLQQQATELAALRGVSVAGISDEHRDGVREAVAEALGNAYDCQRVWSAWNVGTMGQDDFTLTAEDGDRVAEIADAAIEVIGNFAMQTKVPVSERLPEPNTKVLAHYFNKLGKGRTVCAIWVPAKTRVSDSDIDEDFEFEYDDETDQFYWPEGWYEAIENWEEFGYLKVYEGEVAYWQPLPKWYASALALPAPQTGEGEA
jgi:hypothetical protein